MSEHRPANHKESAAPDEPDIDTNKTPKGETSVGYGRPPTDTRFKPGKSGNKRGRPPGRANAKGTIARVINETVPVREGDRTRKMTKLEAVLQAHTMKAIKGDGRSASILIGLVSKLGLLGESETETLAQLSEEDDAILEDYVHRHAGPTKNDSGSEEQ
jgi:hypothetical protein